MIPSALIQGEQKRKAAKAPKRKVYTVDVEIDGKRYEFDLEADSQPTEADVMGVVNQYAGQIRKGNKAFNGATPSASAESNPFQGAKATAKVPRPTAAPQQRQTVPQPPQTGVPGLMQRIQQGTTTQGVEDAASVFRDENRKNPSVTEAFGKIPTADEVRQGRKAGESAGQFASRKSNEATEAVKNNPAFTALYEFFGKPGMQGLSAVGLKPKELAAGIVTSPYDMTLDISVLLSQQATAQEKAGAIANLFGTDLAGPLLGKAVGVAAKALKNKRAAQALVDGLKAFDLTGGGAKAEPKVPSVLDEVLGEPKVQPVEQMPPPVAMDSPVMGSVGEAVPRGNPQLEVNAKTHFGTTRNPLEAGYITSDGQLLDFSGRHETEPRFARQFDGVRYTDHRDVSQIMDEGGTEAMLKFMGDTGAVRFSSMPNGGILVDAAAPLTPQQWSQLQSAVRGATDITFEISDPVTGRTLWSKAVDINRSADATRVFNEAKRYWEANPPKTPAPTSARYGPNYGTPQPGQGQRVGYPKAQPSVLDEVLETQNASRARYSELMALAQDESKLLQMSEEELDELAMLDREFGERFERRNHSATVGNRLSYQAKNDLLSAFGLKGGEGYAIGDPNVMFMMLDQASERGSVRGSDVADFARAHGIALGRFVPDLNEFAPGPMFREWFRRVGTDERSARAVKATRGEVGGAYARADVYRGVYELTDAGREALQKFKSVKFFGPKNWTDEVQNANAIRAGSEVPRTSEVSGDAKPAATRSIDLLPSDKSAANANKWAELLWWNGYDGNNPSVTAGETYIKQVFGSKAELNRRIKAAVKSGELPSAQKERRVGWVDKHGHDAGASVEYNLVSREDFANWLDNEANNAQNTTENAPVRPVETPQPPAAVVEPSAQTVTPGEQEYFAHLRRMDEIAKSHNAVLEQGVKSGDLELRNGTHYPKTENGQAIISQARELSSEWDSMRLNESTLRWRMDYNENGTFPTPAAQPRITAPKKTNKQEAEWIAALNDAQNPTITRISSKSGKRGEEFVISDGGEIVARIPTAKLSEETRKRLAVGDIVHSDEFSVQRRVQVKDDAKGTGTGADTGNRGIADQALPRNEGLLRESGGLEQNRVVMGEDQPGRSGGDVQLGQRNDGARQRQPDVGMASSRTQPGMAGIDPTTPTSAKWASMESGGDITRRWAQFKDQFSQEQKDWINSQLPDSPTDIQLENFASRISNGEIAIPTQLLTKAQESALWEQVGKDPRLFQYGWDGAKIFDDLRRNVTPEVSAQSVSPGRGAEAPSTVGQSASPGSDLPADLASSQRQVNNTTATPTSARQADINADVPDGPTGFARAFGDEVGTSPTTVEAMAQRGKDLTESAETSHKSVYEKVARGEALSPDDIAVGIYRQRWIANRSKQITTKLADPDLSIGERAALESELDELITERGGQLMDTIRASRGQWHQMGMTLQIGLDEDYSLAKILSDAKAANRGKELDPTAKKALEDAVARLDKLDKELVKLRDQVFAGITSGKPAVKTGDRATLAASIRGRLGLGKDAPATGGMPSKQSGALKVPESEQKRLAREINALARGYIANGAKDIDDVLGMLKEDIPGLTDDDYLSLLSGSYRTKVLTMDVEKNNLNRALTRIKTDAAQRELPQWQQYMGGLGDGYVSFQRQMQAAGDASFAFIQGLPGLLVDPKSWGKSWSNAGRAFKGGQEAADLMQAELQRMPTHPYARKAGVKFSDLNGTYTGQEEMLQGHLLQKMRESKVPVIKQYAEVLSRSNEAYTAFLNRLRQYMFDGLVQGRHTDGDLMRDMARLTNILTGRGDGKIAEALSNKTFAYALYAPRFMLSQFQNAYLPFLLPTFKTGAGKAAAMKSWGKQVAVVWGSYELAKVVFGDENVDTDMRSATFGEIRTPWGVINPIGKIAQPYTLPVQMALGRISTKGEFAKPGYGSAGMLGSFIMNKASPVAKLAKDQAIGEKFNYDKWEAEPFTVFSADGLKSTLKEQFTPLAAQQAAEGGVPDELADMSHIIMSLLGLSSKPIEKAKKDVKKTVPMERPLPKAISEGVQNVRKNARKMVGADSNQPGIIPPKY